MRLSERLRAIEKESLKERYFVRRENKPPKSIASEKSRVPMSRRLDAAAQAAKLKVEMKFLEQETNVRRLLLEKEIAFANAEEKAIRMVMKQVTNE